jgi:hypothetical protein
MSVNLPSDVSKKIKQCVYKKADFYGYLERGRVENGRFMESLVVDPEIGGVLSAYIDKSKIHKYIKDGILNRYSKDKKTMARPSNLSEIVVRLFGVPVVEIDLDANSNVTLFKSILDECPNRYVVVSEGTFSKWETALRKSLLYMPGKPFAESPDNQIEVMLLLFANSRPIPPSDKVHLERALGRYGCKVFYFGEP